MKKTFTEIRLAKSKTHLDKNPLKIKHLSLSQTPIRSKATEYLDHQMTHLEAPSTLFSTQRLSIFGNGEAFIQAFTMNYKFSLQCILKYFQLIQGIPEEILEEVKVEMAFLLMEIKNAEGDSNKTINCVLQCLEAFLEQYKKLKDLIYAQIDRLKIFDSKKDKPGTKQLKPLFDEVIEKNIINIFSSNFFLFSLIVGFTELVEAIEKWEEVLSESNVLIFQKSREEIFHKKKRYLNSVHKKKDINRNETDKSLLDSEELKRSSNFDISVSSGQRK
ncbi:unnamed protein product [Moneuplotes crassus]|uniref:Uncharacterized protein n=1 Tax=Euplotes crassus TaxID=5936 RepID=A0AAD1UG75_EUPCR|nr:unnamed protein product [Moneuplotes crassus]